MPTSLPERIPPDRPVSQREILGICFGYGAVLLVFACLIAYDARVITWVSDAAQAEFGSSVEPTAAKPVLLAVQKTVIK